ncbi:MAG TPA: helix-turn-helix transcriptional regulator, partial [Pseudonocardiaceae bacterium]|nr:helix-turn-helix transcriptional regulator [Pseudonocardiaceae bacterium]
VRIRRISRVLRGWREATGLKSGEIAKKAGWSSAKQSRLETAGQPITPADVVTLALVYGISEDERTKMFEATLTAQEKSWWEEVAKGALVDDVLDYVELESEAHELKTFRIDLVHGLFQTEDYTAAVLGADVPTPGEDIVRERVQARVARQSRLVGDDPIQVDAVIAEGALRMVVGGPAVMRAQLNHLLELGALPHIQLRVLPAKAGAHCALGTGFSLLSFEGENSDVGYIEVLTKGVYLEEPAELEPYRLAFATLWDNALAEDESAAMISSIARGMKH